MHLDIGCRYIKKCCGTVCSGRGIKGLLSTLFESRFENPTLGIETVVMASELVRLAQKFGRETTVTSCSHENPQLRVNESGSDETIKVLGGKQLRRNFDRVSLSVSDSSKPPIVVIGTFVSHHTLPALREPSTLIRSAGLRFSSGLTFYGEIRGLRHVTLRI